MVGMGLGSKICTHLEYSYLGRDGGGNCGNLEMFGDFKS